MATALNTIKNWFKTGLKPTQTQFWAVWDSFWHKDDSIPIASIENLQDLLDDKIDAAAIPVTRPILIVNGNPFTFVKNPNNNAPELQTTLQINDFIVNGAWDGTEFWDLAIALGTQKDSKTNWKVLRDKKEIPLI